jgi:gliding motility-associated protein GldM
MLAINVAAEVLEAFKVVDSSLIQTLETVDTKNNQVYASFEQAYAENQEKVQEWKEKADLVKEKTDSMFSFITHLKEELVSISGSKPINDENPLLPDDFYFVKENGDTLEISNESDLNVPSEYMITQGNAAELKNRIIEFRSELIELIGEDDVELVENILQSLDTPDPPVNLKEGGENKSWETQRFQDKPLIAVLTLLSKIQIDVKNSEANLLNYLFAQIDAGSFKFNKLGARVIPNSSLILQGDEYVAEVFLAAEDTTQQPEIIINGRPVEVKDGKATFRMSPSQPGTFSWSGLIKYKTPEGIIRNYDFEQEFQVTRPSVTMSATKMNVFYKGLDNPFDVSGGGIPREDLDVTMTNGTIVRNGDGYFIRPDELDELGNRTKVTVFATINGERRQVGESDWRVRRVPDPVAQVAGQSGGDIRKERLIVEQGVLAVLEDFLFDYTYTVTQFNVQITGAGGYTNIWTSTTNRFTPEMKDQFQRLNPNSFVYIANIKAIGEDGELRDLDPISFKIQ